MIGENGFSIALFFVPVERFRFPLRRNSLLRDELPFPGEEKTLKASCSILLYVKNSKAEVVTRGKARRRAELSPLAPPGQCINEISFDSINRDPEASSPGDDRRIFCK